MPINDIAHSFADALNGDDYQRAHALLAGDCIYEARTKVITGPDAIIKSYRANSLFARTLFDRVEYSSEISESISDTARITFVDKLHKGDQTHVYRCQQTVRIREDGLIDRIKHKEIPDERKQLLEFCAKCKIDLG